MGTRCLSTGRRNWHGAINHNNSIWIRRNYFVVKSTGNKLSFKNMIIAGFSDFGLEARTPSPARIMVSKKHTILPPGPDSASEEQREGKLGRGLLRPSLISPSDCITSAKFKCFTRNYHQHPSAPSLSEQVNDLSPGLSPRVTVITAGSLQQPKVSNSKEPNTFCPAKRLGKPDHGTS